MQNTVKATAKTVNYTPEQEMDAKNSYLAGEACEAIAARMGKSAKSVISKLVRMGVYVKKERTDKNGQPVVKKEALIEQVTQALTLTEAESESFSKVNKSAILKVLQSLKDA
jgi:response regulator RpfG family c-di-GMP phosphodiesterase